MSYRRLTDLPAACRKSGLKVVVVPGWQKRGRPASTGQFNPRGVMAHHTGAHGTNSRASELAYVKRVLVPGFSHLPGPLCQIALGRQTRDGAPVVYIVAAGRANHAGPSKGPRFMTSGDGNRQTIGIEAINSAFEGWSAAQLDAYHRLCAALCDHYRWPRGNVVSHHESSTSGKWDPGTNYKPISMATFRRSVAAVRKGSNVAITKKEARQIAAEVWRYEMGGARGDKKESAGQRLRMIRASARETNESVDRAEGRTHQMLSRIVKKLGA